MNPLFWAFLVLGAYILFSLCLYVWADDWLHLFRCRRKSALGYRRLHRLKTLSLQSKELEGCYVEAGCYKGGSVALVTPYFQKLGRKVWALDSFEGLPPPDPAIDVNFKGNQWTHNNNKATLQDFYNTFQACKVSLEGVTVVKGWFEDTIPKAKPEMGKIALLHIDADFYKAVKYCLEELYDRVEVGGFVVIDDYRHWNGCRRAVDEFRTKHNITSPLIKTDYTSHYWVKP